MEAFGIIGMTFGILAWIQVMGLRQEVDKIKSELREVANLSAQPKSESTSEALLE